MARIPFGKGKDAASAPDAGGSSSRAPKQKGSAIGDPKKKGRAIIIVGGVLGLITAVALVVLVNQLASTSGTGTGTGAPAAQTTEVIVAAHPIAAKTVITSADITKRQVPVDAGYATAITSVDAVVGRISAIAITKDSPILAAYLLSASAGGTFSIQPDASSDPTTEWRAVSVAVPDDRAVGGQLVDGMYVDIWVTVQANPPQGTTQSAANGWYPDKTTGLLFQNVLILSKSNGLYILRVDEVQATQILHLAASGQASFSMALRPEGDTKVISGDSAKTTTNLILETYKLLIPQQYP